MARWYSEIGEEFGTNTMTREEHDMRERIIKIIAQHTSTFYGGYGYASEEGVKEEDYDEVADSIMEAFTMIEKEKQNA
jgi:hypothetical protein